MNKSDKNYFTGLSISRRDVPGDKVTLHMEEYSLSQFLPYLFFVLLFCVHGYVLTGPFVFAGCVMEKSAQGVLVDFISNIFIL